VRQASLASFITATNIVPANSSSSPFPSTTPSNTGVGPRPSITRWRSARSPGRIRIELTIRGWQPEPLPSPAETQRLDPLERVGEDALRSLLRAQAQ
jgi:hypothetical protein